MASRHWPASQGAESFSLVCHGRCVPQQELTPEVIRRYVDVTSSLSPEFDLQVVRHSEFRIPQIHIEAFARFHAK